jgi:hypothetical protein
MFNVFLQGVLLFLGSLVRTDVDEAIFCTFTYIDIFL